MLLKNKYNCQLRQYKRGKNITKKLKIGSKTKAEKDFKLCGVVSGDSVNVKKGDEGVITKHGIKYITGEARGCINLVDDNVDKNNYDINSICESIFSRLRGSYGYAIDDLMEDEGVTREEVIDIIFDELNEYI